jgi:Spy/CpxP family protein refolding chaperone
MKRNSKTGGTLILGIVSMMLGSCVTLLAQQPQAPNQIDPVQTQTTQTTGAQANQLPDFRLLNLTPDQIQKIREINIGLKDERQAANFKLRQAQRALAEAVESPTPNEDLIAQRSREVAEAQANTIRLRSVTEARILQVLTPEQRMRLRDMRQRNLALRRANQQQQNPNGLGQRQGLRKQNGPLLSPAQQKAIRRQQKP